MTCSTLPDTGSLFTVFFCWAANARSTALNKSFINTEDAKWASLATQSTLAATPVAE